MIPNQLTTLGSTEVQLTKAVGSAKNGYLCANADITRGITHQASSIKECYERFPNIKEIGESLGITCDYAIFPDEVGTITDEERKLLDLYTGLDNTEAKNVKEILGEDWLGCLWGSPEAQIGRAHV